MIQNPNSHDCPKHSELEYQHHSIFLIRLLYRYTGGQIPIIGGGGVFSGEDAYCKIRSGASLVQIYTAFIYKGPYAAIEINSALSSLLKNDGFQNISDAVGVDVSL